MNDETITITPSKCAWCEGSGKWRVAPGHFGSCIVCGGKGSVKVTQPPVVCLQCDGKGRANSVRPCFTCAGTGWESYLTKSAKIK